MNIVSREDTGHFPLESGDGNVEDKDDCNGNDRNAVGSRTSEVPRMTDKMSVAGKILNMWCLM